MKKILFVEQNQDGTVGGSHYCLLYLVRSLDREKYEPIVMFYEDNAIKRKFIDIGCDVIIYRKPVGMRFPRRFFFLQKIYNFVNGFFLPTARFFLFLLEKKIDLVHLNNSTSAGSEWLFAAKLLRKKCITHERGWVTKTNITARFARYFDLIICVSSSVREQIVRIGLGNKSIVLYDGMNPVQFAGKVRCSSTEARREFVSEPDRPFLGMVGNFQAWKGQNSVVGAVRLLKNKYPDLVCLLVGGVSLSSDDDTGYYNRLVSQIEEFGLSENIIITGYRSDVPTLVNSFDLFIHASIAPEPFGMVLLEAMCLSKAIIATDIGGPREIIENGKSGFLIHPSDSKQLAQKIDFLLVNQDIRDKIGNNARKRVAEKFSLEDFSLRVNQLYNNLFEN